MVAPTAAGSRWRSPRAPTATTGYAAPSSGSPPSARCWPRAAAATAAASCWSRSPSRCSPTIGRAGGRLERSRAGSPVIGAAFDSTLAAAVGGDERAFALLWRDVQPGLLRYLQVVAPGAAEDLASDTWVDVVRSLARFRGGEQSFRSWTFTIARHRAVDHQRHNGRRPADPVPTERIATYHALALIAELPRDQAEVVALRVVAGLEVSQVASIVGKRPGAVRVLAHRGLRRLAKRLATGRPTPAGPGAGGVTR